MNLSVRYCVFWHELLWPPLRERSWECWCTTAAVWLWTCTRCSACTGASSTKTSSPPSGQSGCLRSTTGTLLWIWPWTALKLRPTSRWVMTQRSYTILLKNKMYSKVLLGVFQLPRRISRFELTISSALFHYLVSNIQRHESNHLLAVTSRVESGSSYLKCDKMISSYLGYLGFVSG